MRRETRMLINKLQKKKYRGFEIRMIEHLEEMGKDWKYEPTRLPFNILESRTYTPDFALNKFDGNVMWLELKGKLAPVDRKKYIAVKEQYPELDLRFVFQKPGNPIRKGSKTTYGAWATKHEFKWSGPIIPREWLAEVAYRD